MKRLLFFSVLSITCLTISAQTNTWTGAGSNTNWNTISNWSLNTVPTAANDVVIPTGFTVNLNVAGNTKSIAVQGNSTFNIYNNLSFLNASSFATNVTVNWTSESLLGGGTMTNNGSVIMTSANYRHISGGTTLINNGMITMPAGGGLYLHDSSIISNTASGVFDIQSDVNVFQYGETHNFINVGLLKKSGGNGNSGFFCHLTNTGTISVESGSLNMTGLTKTFDGGVYNVSTGSSLILTTQVDVSNTLTGVLDGALNWANNVSVATTATFDFTGDTGVHWTNNSLIGGGTLTNVNTISLASGELRYISGGTTLINNGTITMPLGGNLYLHDTSILNNTAYGVFHIQSDANVYSSGESNNFINIGLLKKTFGTGNSNFGSILTNTGTISVESGSLTMVGSTKSFNGGIYNVSTGSSLILATQVDVSSTLTGVLDGALNWANNVSVATTATFDFTGDIGVHWTDNGLIGGGTLTNVSRLTLSSGNSRNISGVNTKFINAGNMQLPSGGFLYLNNNATIDNQASGVIDFQSDAGISYIGNEAFSIKNAGLIIKSAGSGATFISPPVTNSGTIDVISGKFEFANGYTLTNTVDGIIKGIATIDLPVEANFINDGIFSPGGNPGTLTVIGDFKSSSTSELQIEIYDTTQGTGYDLLAIQGNAIMDGDINLALYFAPNLNDEFVVVTANNITSCNLPATTTQNHDGHIYTFDVICNPDNVTLKVTNIVLGTETNTLSNVKLFPNPSNGNFTIDLGREYTDVSVQIYNILGHLISSEKYASAKIIDQNINASAGIYFVKVSTAKEESNTLRIIKQ